MRRRPRAHGPIAAAPPQPAAATLAKDGSSKGGPLLCHPDDPPLILPGSIGSE